MNLAWKLAVVMLVVGLVASVAAAGELAVSGELQDGEIGPPPTPPGSSIPRPAEEEDGCLLDGTCGEQRGGTR